MKPFRINFKPVVTLLGDAERDRLAVNTGRKLAQRGQHTLPVAVVGGGPSLEGRLEELRQWPGEIWAINDTANWLMDRGIEATFYTSDPSPMTTRAERRLLASWCDPSLFNDQAEMFHLIEHDPNGVPGGTTSATRAPALALRLGYLGVHFFGCDSSFEGRDHVDKHEGLADELIIAADGKTFHTYPQFLMQAENLVTMMKMAPDVFVNKSDGLLKAMLNDDEWSVVAVSDHLKRHLIDVNGDSGIFDKPYGACKECGQSVGHYDDCPVGMGVL